LSKVIIYCDEDSDEMLAERFLAKDDMADAKIERLPSYANAPGNLKPLLAWERLDWVVTVEGRVVSAVELSRHGYTGDNSFQRFARLYRAASLGIPVIYFTPFKRTRLNEVDEGRYSPRNVAPELFQTLSEMSEGFSVPCLAVDWPTGPDGVPLPLVHEGASGAAEELGRLVRSIEVADLRELQPCFPLANCL
jgi:hypothetical protein